MSGFGEDTKPERPTLTHNMVKVQTPGPQSMPSPEAGQSSPSINTDTMKGGGEGEYGR